jgi:hypothetical protein
MQHLEARIGIVDYNRFTCSCGARFFMLEELIAHARKSKCYTTRASKKGLVLLAMNDITEKIIEVEFT